jgi:hypothetical protein
MAILREKCESLISGGKLYDETQGMFLAATEDCRQIDIWGNAYMLYIGFPCGSKRAETIVPWFIRSEGFNTPPFRAFLRY